MRLTFQVLAEKQTLYNIRKVCAKSGPLCNNILEYKFSFKYGLLSNNQCATLEDPGHARDLQRNVPERRQMKDAQ